MKLAQGRDCESCGSDQGVVGAHFNIDKGGTGYRVPGAVAWLCFHCHNVVDGRVKVPDREVIRTLKRIVQRHALDRFEIFRETQDA